jgi:molybdopterin-guanine dinucleotide biosynthesis protein A
MSDEIGGIVLAGGRSSRFGGDKLRATMDGRTVLDRAIAAVKEVAHVVVVVAAPGSRLDVPPGVRLAHDAVAYDGPLRGISAGFAAQPPEVDRIVVVGGDMPTLVPAVLADLVACLDDDARPDIALLEADGRRALLPMAIRRSVAPRLDELLESGERRLGAFAESVSIAWLPSRIWREADPTGATLVDVDVPSDLSRG